MEKVTIVKTFSFCNICSHYKDKNKHKSQYVVFNLNIPPYQTTSPSSKFIINMRNFNTNIGIAICIKHLPYKYIPFIPYSICSCKQICYSLEEDKKRGFLDIIGEKYIITI